MDGASLKSSLRTAEIGDRDEHRSRFALKGRQEYARKGVRVNHRGQTTKRENLYPRITHRWSSISIAPPTRSMPAGSRRISELRHASRSSDEPQRRARL
jgi:hypothetical protein